MGKNTINNQDTTQTRVIKSNEVRLIKSSYTSPTGDATSWLCNVDVVVISNWTRGKGVIIKLCFTLFILTYNSGPQMCPKTKDMIWDAAIFNVFICCMGWVKTFLSVDNNVTPHR